MPIGCGHKSKRLKELTRNLTWRPVDSAPARRDDDTLKPKRRLLVFNLLLSTKALRAVILLFLLGVLTQAMPAQAHDYAQHDERHSDYVGGGEIQPLHTRGRNVHC